MRGEANYRRIFDCSTLIAAESCEGQRHGWDGRTFINSIGVVLGIATGTNDITYSVSNARGTVTATHMVYIEDCSAGINEIAAPSQDFILYPNPAHDDIMITASAPINSIVISNLLGQPVFSGSYSATSAVISTSALPPGLYIARINGNVIGKFVKE